jgi:sulfate/thiosulfate transport system substrate-binding protein
MRSNYSTGKHFPSTPPAHLSSIQRVRPVRFGVIALLAACATLALSSCSSSTNAGGGSGTTTINLVAYSTPSLAYAKLIAAFEQTPAGKNISVTTSFGASGTQANDVVDGAPADVVNFSLEPDMAKLVKAGLVSSSWDTVGPDNGMVTNSVVVFVVRKGNPDHIQNWSDLIRSGVKVITPNPFSSGSARWNIMAAYGAALASGDSPSDAQGFLKSLLANTVAQPASASDAMETFLSGEGDVLLDYEDDAITSQRKGAAIQYVVPPQTILIQNPIAVLTKSSHKAAAQAFVNYLLSEAGQELWAKEGYRPVIASAATAAGVSFPTPSDLFTITSLGGWTKDAKSFFDPQTGIVTKIEASLGVSTASG